jgi:hypothetical protein
MGLDLQAEDQIKSGTLKKFKEDLLCLCLPPILNVFSSSFDIEERLSFSIDMKN